VFDRVTRGDREHLRQYGGFPFIASAVGNMALKAFSAPIAAALHPAPTVHFVRNFGQHLSKD
jgi:hypothetical protein